MTMIASASGASHEEVVVPAEVLPEGGPPEDNECCCINSRMKKIALTILLIAVSVAIWPFAGVAWSVGFLACSGTAAFIISNKTIEQIAPIPEDNLDPSAEEGDEPSADSVELSQLPDQTAILKQREAELIKLQFNACTNTLEIEIQKCVAMCTKKGNDRIAISQALEELSTSKKNAETDLAATMPKKGSPSKTQQGKIQKIMQSLMEATSMEAEQQKLQETLENEIAELSQRNRKLNDLANRVKVNENDHEPLKIIFQEALTFLNLKEFPIPEDQQQAQEVAKAAEQEAKIIEAEKMTPEKELAELLALPGNQHSSKSALIKEIHASFGFVFAKWWSNFVETFDTAAFKLAKKGSTFTFTHLKKKEASAVLHWLNSPGVVTKFEVEKSFSITLSSEKEVPCISFKGVSLSSTKVSINMGASCALEKILFNPKTNELTLHRGSSGFLTEWQVSDGLKTSKDKIFKTSEDTLIFYYPPFPNDLIAPKPKWV